MTTGLTSIGESTGRSRAGQWLRRLARGVLALVVLAIALPLGGVAYEAIASRSDARAHPAPGRLVDVGGFRLHINCVGVGSPTVILDAGLGETSLDWSLVQPELGATTRVCAYDRAGLGWSEASPQARTPDNIAEELHTLLVNAGIAGPYVLVAHSLSGKYARLFARHHEAETAGIVLVDARSEFVDALTTQAENRAFVDAVEAQGRQYALARRFGIARLFGAQLAGSSSLPAETRSLMALLGTQQSAIAATTGEARARATSDEGLSARPALGDLPLIVLVSDQSIAMVPHWADAQRRQTALSSEGRMIVAAKSSHFIQLDRPRLVIDSVGEVIASARKRATS
jgi:pimeloyl-ACP methyl ester carboxylesterase